MLPEARVTAWLRDWRDGDDAAIERVTAEVYADLRRLAGHYLRGEQRDHTLQPTALVHEAYLRIESIRNFDWQARGHFVAVMAQTMRRILIDHARKRRAAKRDGGTPVPDDVAALEIQAPGMSTPSIDVLIVDEALTALATEHPRLAEAVELRFFGGLTSPEIAQVLTTSVATVERDWRFARAWLHNRLEP